MSTVLYKALRAVEISDELAERATESISIEAATRTDLKANLIERIYRAAAVVSAAAGVSALF